MNKKSVLYIFFALQLLVISTSCKNCECNPENTLAMNDTTFNDKFECLDLEFLRKNNTHPNALTSTNSYIYEERYNNGHLKIYIEGGIAYISIDHSKFLSIYKSYYPDGKIEEKCLQNDLGFLIGRFYKFNTSGMLVETIDEDKGFDFTFEQLKEVLIRDEGLSFDDLIPVDDGGGVKYPIRIIRDVDPDPVWKITYNDKDNSMDGIYGTEIAILYDGKTGERISRTLMPLNP